MAWLGNPYNLTTVDVGKRLRGLDITSVALTFKESVSVLRYSEYCPYASLPVASVEQSQFHNADERTEERNNDIN